MYPDAVKLSNHTITIECGSIAWDSRDFGIVVHECQSTRPDAILRAMGDSLWHVEGGPVTFYGNIRPSIL